MKLKTEDFSKSFRSLSSFCFGISPFNARATANIWGTLGMIYIIILNIKILKIHKYYKYWYQSSSSNVA